VGVFEGFQVLVLSYKVGAYGQTVLQQDAGKGNPERAPKAVEEAAQTCPQPELMIREGGHGDRHNG
jgi:hypothetical protein